MKTAVFGDVTSCSSVRSTNDSKKPDVSVFYPEDTRQQIPPKCLQLTTKHDLTSGGSSYNFHCLIIGVISFTLGSMDFDAFPDLTWAFTFIFLITNSAIRNSKNHITPEYLQMYT